MPEQWRMQLFVAAMMTGAACSVRRHKKEAARLERPPERRRKGQNAGRKSVGR
jgi:hypothetical protein